MHLLVDEEQKHSALFRRGLEHLGASPLDSHWSDEAFTRLRRALGLRTELALFLIAESVAMPYFAALADSAPDPVLRLIGLRIATDERNHIRFQIDGLRESLRRTPRLLRTMIVVAWWPIAVGAAAVILVDHGAALRSCGLSPITYWRAAVRQFRDAVRGVLRSARHPPLGPLT
ncbi:hypothetical protein EF847_10900 [Actinobacteria bacterium YIM 96077]|uniref:Ferritin-like domain-containing protein n=1 Tax=Phytoactinopolyspora halophila TaxID=1981511 RepID=A0A329QZ08_9ACTN|nr:hypothetical protein [Phytoactinopolyspora halophila]AYY13130.1 hypothetical protein EF847_10900 [Actinobacteria bacterium YIM 96077]RAW17630.1 hypothetical protein DPM12_06525 [Phytoactinopolyspora halophila]